MRRQCLMTCIVPGNEDPSNHNPGPNGCADAECQRDWRNRQEQRGTVKQDIPADDQERQRSRAARQLNITLPCQPAYRIDLAIHWVPSMP